MDPSQDTKGFLRECSYTTWQGYTGRDNFVNERTWAQLCCRYPCPDCSIGIEELIYGMANGENQLAAGSHIDIEDEGLHIHKARLPSGDFRVMDHR